MVKRGIAFGWSVLCLVALQPSAFAKAGYGMAGCGLGSVLVGSQGGQIFAGTTNSTSANQGFGITSGTSNCQNSSQMEAMAKQHEFLSANLVNFQKEVAQGQGATITALVELFGCTTSVQGHANEVLVQNYDAIFRSPGVAGILSSVREKLEQDEALATQCQNLG